MTKYQEDFFYYMYEELSQNKKLKKIFNKKLFRINCNDKYKYSTVYEKHELAFRKAKKKLAKKLAKKAKLNSSPNTYQTLHA